MRWLMSWSPSISRRRGVGVCGLLALLALGVVPAPAQDVDQKYNQALQLFGDAKVEDAYELLLEVDKESPGYKGTKNYLKMAKTTVNKLYKSEADLFHDCEGLFNQSPPDYPGAKQKCELASKVRVNHPKYRSQISSLLSQIDSREREETLFQEGSRLFNERNYREAQSRLKQVAGPRAGEARALLAKIDEALGKQRAEEEMNKLFNDGVQLFKAGNTTEAYYKFDQVARAGGPKAAEARTYLQRIDQMGRQQRDAEKNAERWFQEGVRLFNERRYSEAQSRFTQVTQGGGPEAGEARTYLARVDEALRKQRADEQSRQTLRPPPATRHCAPACAPTLRAISALRSGTFPITSTRKVQSRL